MSLEKEPQLPSKPSRDAFHELNTYMAEIGLLNIHEVDVDNPLSFEEAQSLLDALSAEERQRLDELFAAFAEAV